MDFNYKVMYTNKKILFIFMCKFQFFTGLRFMNISTHFTSLPLLDLYSCATFSVIFLMTILFTYIASNTLHSLYLSHCFFHQSYEGQINFCPNQDTFENKRDAIGIYTGTNKPWEHYDKVTSLIVHMTS